MKKHLDTAVDSVKEGLFGVLVFVAVVWGVFLLDLLVGLVTRLELSQWIDLNPRQWTGLIGIVTMPFVHAGWVHIISNTIPLIVLLTLLAGSKAKSWYVVGLIIVLGGAMTWLIGNSGKAHVGASGLVFGLITFLIASGLMEIFTVKRNSSNEPLSFRVSRRIVSLAISILVGLVYGTSLLRGLVPLFPGRESISWSGHWCGAVAGVIVAYLWTRKPVDAAKPVPSEVAAEISA